MKDRLNVQKYSFELESFGVSESKHFGRLFKE